MEKLEQMHQWLSSGKQIGKRFSYIKDGKTYWSSVGVQKWNEEYKVYIDEIEESKMDSEDFEKEIIECFHTIAEAIEFAESNSNVDVEGLSPCKGQKIFNPSFN